MILILAYAVGVLLAAAYLLARTSRLTVLTVSCVLLAALAWPLGAVA